MRHPDTPGVVGPTAVAARPRSGQPIVDGFPQDGAASGWPLAFPPAGALGRGETPARRSRPPPAGPASPPRSAAGRPPPPPAGRPPPAPGGAAPPQPCRDPLAPASRHQPLQARLVPRPVRLRPQLSVTPCADDRAARPEPRPSDGDGTPIPTQTGSKM